MLTFLDESYGQGILIIGTLHIPTESERTFLHKGLLKIKNDFKFLNKNGHVKEIKYSNLTSRKRFEIAKATFDLFNKSYKSFFRAGVIQYTENDLNKMHKLSNAPLPVKVKKAMLYTKIVELLIKNNYEPRKINNGVLLMDNLVRCKGDNFNAIITDKLINSKKPYLKHMSYIDSKEESTHVIQICDLLLGSLRSSFFKTKNKYKNNFSLYVRNKLNLPSTINYWRKLKQGRAEAKFPKFTVRVYGVPYKY